MAHWTPQVGQKPVENPAEADVVCQIHGSRSPDETNGPSSFPPRSISVEAVYPRLRCRHASGPLVFFVC